MSTWHRPRQENSSHGQKLSLMTGSRHLVTYWTSAMSCYPFAFYIAEVTWTETPPGACTAFPDMSGAAAHRIRLTMKGHTLASAAKAALELSAGTKKRITSPPRDIAGFRKLDWWLPHWHCHSQRHDSHDHVTNVTTAPPVESSALTIPSPLLHMSHPSLSLLLH